MAEKRDTSEILARRIQQAIENNDLAELRDCLDNREFKDFNFLDMDKDINRRLVKPLTVYAAERGSVDVLKILFDYGYDPNARDSIGNTPLLVAIAQERTDIVRFLLNHPNVRVDLANDYGEDIYSIAQMNENKEILACVETVTEPIPFDLQANSFHFSTDGTQDVVGCC